MWLPLGTHKGRHYVARGQELRNDMLVGIPDYPGDTAQLSDFGRRTLRVAAGYQNPAARVCPMDTPDQLPNLGIRPAGHRAGVQNRHLARGDVLYLLQPRFEQLLLDRSAVGLARAASEIENLERGHNRRSNGDAMVPCGGLTDGGPPSLPQTDL